MKRLAGIVFLMACILVPFRTADAGGSGEPGKYWIRFRDKQAGEAPLALSDRTLQRRLARGSGFSVMDDQPVSSAYLAMLKEQGIEAIVESRWLNAISARLTPDQIQSIRALPFVAEVRPVAMLKTTRANPATAPLVNAGASTLQLTSMNALAPLERGINGKGVRIGFLDTEFGDFTHPVFSKLISEGRLIAYMNFTGQVQSDRHGLATASVAVGYAEGVLIGPAYGAELVAATTEYAPTETHQEEDYFVAGLEWLESMGVDVVNASLGYTTFDTGIDYTHADLNGDVAPTSIAVDMAVKRGVVVVTSAGNEADCTRDPDCFYYIGTPGDADSVITVGAINPDSTRASFSSHGPTSDGRIKPDVVALGSFFQTNQGYVGLVAATEKTAKYEYTAGTSFSSPLVAAVVAQMLQVNPKLKPMEVRDILRTTASQPNAPDNNIGWGIVNADAAVREAESRATGIDQPDSEGLPVSSGLSVAIYPHPVATHATIQIISPRPEPRATVRLYDVTGRLVTTVFAGPLNQGKNFFDLGGHDLNSGVYLYVLSAGSEVVRGKIVVVH